MSLLKQLLTTSPPTGAGIVTDAYRKSLEVDGTVAGEQTDYQVEIELDMFSALPTNAAGFQTTPTSDATGQVVHPSILYFPDGWNGYKYWMAMTPYPGGVNDTETPEILACDDGVNWVVPEGLTNPIVARDATNPNTDPCLFYNEATDELWVYWRKMSGTYNRLYLKKSGDGVDWGGTGPGALLLDLGTSSLSCPEVAKVGGTYHLWYVRTADAPNGIKHRTSADGESWGSEGACNLYGTMPSGKEPWHLEVRYMTDFSEYWILLTVCNTGTGGTASILAFAKSRDGVDLYMYPEVLLYLGAGGNWDNTIVYKATAILDDSTLKIWYSACNAALVWHVGYTTATIDATITDMMSKMRLDNGDLRFTEDDGVTELDYWLEESFGGKIKAWVKVSTIPVEGTTIYVYYGKDDATTTSSIKDASWNSLGDDFNDNARDTGIWDIVEEENGSPSEANQRLECVNPTAGSGSGYVTVNNFSMNNVEMRVFLSNLTISSMELAISNQKVIDDNPSTTDDWYKVMMYNATNFFYVQGEVAGGGANVLYSGGWLADEGIVKIRIENGTIRLYEQDTERHNEAFALTSRDCYIYIYGRSGVAEFVGTDWADAFWIRKYVSPEPSLGAWGAEEGIVWPF